MEASENLSFGEIGEQALDPAIDQSCILAHPDVRHHGSFRAEHWRVDLAGYSPALIHVKAAAKIG